MWNKISARHLLWGEHVGTLLESGQRIPSMIAPIAVRSDSWENPADMFGEYMPHSIGRAATYVCAWLMSVASFSFAGELHKAPGLQVQLVTDSAAVAPGASFHAGLYFRLEEGWHIYWQNAGDSG